MTDMPPDEMHPLYPEHPLLEAKEKAESPLDAAACFGSSGVEAAVCEDIAKRQRLGIQKYGVTVADNPLDLHEWLQHAYEECLDQAVYLKRAMLERDKWREKAEHLAIHMVTANDAIESLTRDLWTVIGVARRCMPKKHGTIERIAANLPENAKSAGTVAGEKTL